MNIHELFDNVVTQCIKSGDTISDLKKADLFINIPLDYWNKYENNINNIILPNNIASTIMNNVMENLEIIVKPTQSGKTFVMLQEIAQMLENDENNIHIIFCDNQILQTEQTSARLEKFDVLEKYSTEEGNISIILSSKSKIKKYTELTHHITDGVKNIVVCSNRKRVNDMISLINHFNSNKLLKIFNFSIWIDEIDKNMDLFYEDLLEWSKNSKITRIGLITATPGKIIKVFKEIKIFKLEQTFDRNIFHSFSESEFKIINKDTTDNLEYLEHVLKEHSKEMTNGQVWFIPGQNEKETHYNIKNLLVKNNFVVIIINGDGKQIYYDTEKFEWIDDMNTENLETENLETVSEILGNLYIKKNLKNHKLAITGNICINRGITINSPKMLITHAIFPARITNQASSYQLAGRVCGNIKKFVNYKKPIIFCSDKFKDTIIDMEKRAKNLAEKAFKIKNDFVDVSSYAFADCEIMNSGIPIKLKITNSQDLKTISNIDKIDKNTRIVVENIIKKYSLTNFNNDFDINKYTLRNKHLIKKESVDKYGISTYGYENFLKHHDNRKGRMPNTNCKNMEYLLYLIIEDIDIWNAKSGDALILYKNNNSEIELESD